MPVDMPAVAVQDGTTPTQRVVQAPLATLSDEVVQEELRSPTLVIIGHVVSLLNERGCAPAELATLPLAPELAKHAVNADEVLEVLSRARPA